MPTVRTISPILGIAILAIIGAGCTVNKVSLSSRQPTGSPISADQVRAYSNFKELQEAYRVEGMISVVVLPQLKNKPPAREELARKTAANMGVNAVVGLMTTEDVSVHWNGGSGLLATVGAHQPAGPKCVVCLPPVSHKVEQGPSLDKLDTYLLQEIQYLIAQSGYYAYQCGGPETSVTAIAEGKVNPANLSEPLGYPPDYALVCEVAGYSDTGVPVVAKFNKVKITLTLFDLKERKQVWSNAKQGGTAQGAAVLGSNLFEGLFTSKDQSMRDAVRSVVLAAFKDLPKAEGFRKL